MEPLVPHILQVISAALNAREEEAARDSILAVADVAEASPKFLRKHMDMVTSSMIQIAATSALDDSTRTAATEFVLSLCENAGGMVRKSRKVVAEALQLSLRLLCEVEDNEDWGTAEQADGFGDSLPDELSELGDQAVDRLARALGGKQTLEVSVNLRACISVHTSA